jgi:hypothetical protein
MLYLTVSSGIVDTPAVLGRVQEALSSDQSKPNATDKRQANPSPAPSAPSTLHGGNAGRARLSTSTQPLPMITSSGDTDNPFILDRVREPTKPSAHALDPGFVSESAANRKSTAPATPNAILRGIAESSNAYTPLKSVARSLSTIMGNCEVRFPSRTFDPQCSQL